ncbi:MAG: efflux RND transporter periplasmic adaptor subunit [Planctomycetaceae bacterium]|nr:efflux RND transporter periplasmic adaptor subunit [Planctomycetaceae bacterium]
MARLVSVFTLIAISGLGILGGCNRPGGAHDVSASGGQPPIRVTAIQPARKTLVRTVELPGRAEAFEVAPLFAKVTGYVAKIPVDIGDPIRGPHGDEPGTVLCELIVPELREELAQKAATVAQTKAEVLQADAGVKLAESTVRSASARVREAQASVAKEEAQFARWQSEFQRVAQLAESGAVTRKVADETRAQLDAADAGRKEVAARIASVEALQQESAAGLEKAQADAVAVRSQLAVAEAEQRRLAAMLDYATIRAPFDGVVVERNVHTGHLVQAGGVNGGKPLLVVMRADPIRVMVDVPEVDAVHVAAGTKVELRIPSLPGEPYVGTVTRTGWSLNETSRTLSAEIDVPNADGRWRPGQYVQVKITVAELENALSLPKTAIVTQDKQTYCFAVGADNKIVRLPVSLGLQAGTDFEIRDGLTGDERVIGVNANAFREGQTVEIAAPAK